jgi:5-methylcytosine-specific restriction protein B
MGENFNLEKTINRKVIPLLLEYFMNDEKEVATILKAANIETEGWPMQIKTT